MPSCKKFYLTDSNGCHILTADGCKIVIPVGGYEPRFLPKEERWIAEDEEIMLFITAFMETRCCELN